MCSIWLSYWISSTRLPLPSPLPDCNPPHFLNEGTRKTYLICMIFFIDAEQCNKTEHWKSINYPMQNILTQKIKCRRWGDKGEKRTPIVQSFFNLMHYYYYLKPKASPLFVVWVFLFLLCFAALKTLGAIGLHHIKVQMMEPHLILQRRTRHIHSHE